MHDGDCDGWIPLNEMKSLLKDIGITGVTEDEIAKAASSSSSSTSSTLSSHHVGLRYCSNLTNRHNLLTRIK